MCGGTVLSVKSVGELPAYVTMRLSHLFSTAMHERIAVLALILSLSLLLAYSAAIHSPTPDELAYLPAGVEHWLSGNFEFARVNPPLVRLLAAVPALICGCHRDCTRHSGAMGQRTEHLVGQDFLTANGTRTFVLISLARFACIPFSIFGGLICWLWARRLYGPESAVCALTLWCFCPNILGNGALILPDVASGACGAGSSYLFWRWLRAPMLRTAVYASLMLGVTQLIKANWLILFALWPLVWLAWRFNGRYRPSDGIQPPTIWQFGIILAAGVAIINAGYGFQGTGTLLGDFTFCSAGLRGKAGPKGEEAAPCGNAFRDTVLSRVPVLLPEQYIVGIDLQRLAAERGRLAYLAGTWKGGGWWYYYIAAALVKMPLGVLLLTVLSTVVRLQQRDIVVEPWDEALLLIPALATFFVISAHVGINRHFRYVLPVLPYTFIWASALFGRVMRGRKEIAVIGVGAIAWGVGSSLVVFPHSLSYFNECVGGPRGGYHMLLDSNTDCGQDLLLLKQWIDDHPNAKPLSVGWHLPHLRPALVGVTAPQPPLTPSAGWHIVSVNEIYSYNQRYRYFSAFEPVGNIGYSMNIYHLGDEDVGRR